MIIERMLEYLICSDILSKYSNTDEDGSISEKYIELRDEFINEYKLPKPIITNPVTDITTK